MTGTLTPIDQMRRSVATSTTTAYNPVHAEFAWLSRQGLRPMTLNKLESTPILPTAIEAGPNSGFLSTLVTLLSDFLSRVAKFGTQTIKDSAQALLSSEDEGRLETLRVAVAAWRKADDAPGDVDQPDDFHARAFLEAVVTSIVQTAQDTQGTRGTHVDTHPPADWTENFCYACGGLPQVAVIRDLPDAVGSRTLSCSMCAMEWRFPRLTCPHCGETEADKLPVHTAESIAHVRVDACGTCSRYIKTVDLRKEGNAVPCVDELAAVELDIWAGEEGLTKLRTNVLGL